MLVSVYCLTYNHEKYIRDTLEGFVSQKTDFEYEVFVHDDASTDHTADIILEYAQKYPDLIKPILQKENQYSKGVSILRTHIWPRMTGKYIAACEGDDYWCDPDKLQSQVSFLEEHPDYTACAHNTMILNLQNGKKRLFIPAQKAGTIPIKQIIEWKKPPHISSLVYKRKLREEAFEFTRVVPGMGDYPLTLWLMSKGNIYYMPQVMSVYRSGVEGSWTQRNGNAAGIADKKIKVLEAFNIKTDYSYSKIVNCTIEKFRAEYYYSTDINKLIEMGYWKLIKLGYGNMAVAVFLQKHFYGLYKMISELLYGKR